MSRRVSRLKIYHERPKQPLNLLMWQQPQQVMYTPEVTTVLAVLCMRWRWLFSFDIISNTPIPSIDIKISKKKIMNTIHDWHYCVKSGAKLILKLSLAVLCVSACKFLFIVCACRLVIVFNDTSLVCENVFLDREKETWPNAEIMFQENKLLGDDF